MSISYFFSAKKI